MHPIFVIPAVGRGRGGDRNPLTSSLPRKRESICCTCLRLDLTLGAPVLEGWRRTPKNATITRGDGPRQTDPAREIRPGFGGRAVRAAVSGAAPARRAQSAT